jgi:hypothetical protein
MGKEKLYLAVQAAGFAMVNPDDSEVMPRQSDKSDPVERHQETWAAPTKVQPTSRQGFTLDWLGFLMSRPAS